MSMEYFIFTASLSEHSVAALHYVFRPDPTPTSQSKIYLSLLLALHSSLSSKARHHQHHRSPNISILNLSLTLHNPTLPPLPPHNRQNNRTSSKKHTKRHAQTPHSLRLKALSPTTARPARKTHDRTALTPRSESHSERPSRFRRTGRRSAANSAAVEVADRPAEEDGDDGES
jgi:hypothetical protein